MQKHSLESYYFSELGSEGILPNKPQDVAFEFSPNNKVKKRGTSQDIMPLPTQFMLKINQISDREVICELLVHHYKPSLLVDPYIKRWLTLSKAGVNLYS